jgi:O-antigen ligase
MNIFENLLSIFVAKLRFFLSKHRYISSHLYFLIVLIVWSFLPLVRLLIVGAGESQNIFEYIFSNISEVLFGLGIILFYREFLEGVKKNWKLFGIWIVLVLLGSAVSYINNGHQLKVVVYGLKLTYLPFLVYFIGSSVNNEEREKKKFNYFIFVLIYSILSIGFHLFYFDFEKKVITSNEHIISEYFIPRTGGFLLTPVPFAMMLSIAAFYGAIHFLFSKNSLWTTTMQLFILFTGMAYSVTRVGLMGFLVVFVLMLFIYKIKDIKRIIFILLLYFFSLLIVFQSVEPILWMFFSSKETITISEGVSRVELWKRSWKSFQNKPILGYGIGMAGAGAVRYFKDSPEKAAVYTTDGWYLKVLNEVGIVGTIMFLIILYFIVLPIIKNYTFFPFEVSLILFFLISAVFNNCFDFFPLNMLFYYLLGSVKSGLKE